MKNMAQRLAVIAVSLMMVLCCLPACTVYYNPDQGEHRPDEQRSKDRGEHRQERGGVVIEIPGKKPDIKPMPN
ncbi:MAG: energy-converting hydrogenase Eha subunit F [Oceanicoccus sp.]